MRTNDNSADHLRTKFASGTYPVPVPPDGEPHSPNLSRWLNKNRTTRGWPSVYLDRDGLRWIGWSDDDGWFVGSRLMRVLTVGGKAVAHAYPGKMAEMTEEANFWQRYAEIGRCAIDERHAIGFIGDESRWATDGDVRHCLWCGSCEQRLHRWTETVEHRAWQTSVAHPQLEPSND